MAQARKRRPMRDWNDLQFVLAVAQSGSFHHAAEKMGAHATTVARRVQEFERELNAKLFVRRAHGMTLTTAGKALVAKANEMEAVVSAVTNDIAGMDGQLAGVVRLYVSEGLGTHWVTPILGDFHRQYPDIALDVVTGSHAGNLLTEKTDISITIVRPTDPRLVAFRLGMLGFSLFASREYLRRRGVPAAIDDLAGHDLIYQAIHHTDRLFNWWQGIVDASDGPTFKTNSANFAVAATQTGFGIALGPSFYRKAIFDLVRLEIELPFDTELWMVSHEETNRSARVRAVGDFLKARFAQDRLWWRGEASDLHKCISH